MASLADAAFIAPLLPLLAAASIWLRPLGPGRRAGVIAEIAALLALAATSLGLVGMLLSGPARVALGFDPALLALTIDPVSITVALLVSFVGWVVARYARTYLAGAAGAAMFHADLLMTLAAVLILTMAASLPVMILAFLAIGAGLRRLLLFFPSRPAARRAATKFTLVWTAGDLALLLATLLLVAAYGTSDIAQLGVRATPDLGLFGHLAIALAIVAAALKTAAFPLHGWLTEVMEAPTPVSAFLHAGIINSGGLLLIKLSALVTLSPGSMAALVMIGGLSALFGASVMLTQSAVKTALAWSTVAQMGFMLLQCGLGLWPLALLHIVAHSLYKAYAFLSSGGAVRAVDAVRRPGPVAVPSPLAVARAFLLAITLYAVTAMVFDLVLGPKSAQALALGAILVFGVAYLVAQGLADTAPRALTRRTALASLGATLGYFGFHRGADFFWGPGLPHVPTAGPLEWALIVLALLSFGLVAVAQAMFPLWAHHPAVAGLRVHLANGLYLNALLDRLIGGFRTAPKS
jgi:NAD(P)H-quinone oxidoreductase subunit 5